MEWYISIGMVKKVCHENISTISQRIAWFSVAENGIEWYVCGGIVLNGTARNGTNWCGRVNNIFSIVVLCSHASVVCYIG